MYSKYGWKLQTTKYDKGTFLLGVNFNTNDEWGTDERESYVCLYLGRVCFVFGKIHYSVDTIQEL